MISIRTLVWGAFITTLCAVQAQTPTTPQTPPAPTPAPPPAKTQNNQTPVPPPPAQVNGLTPPIQSKTPTAQVPPLVDVPPPPVPTPGVPIAPLTAEDAARIALHLQPNVAIAGANVFDARGQLIQQRSFLYPNIGLKESVSQSDAFYNHGANNGGIGSTGGATGTTAGTTGTTTGATTGTTAGTTGTTTGATTGTTAGTTGTTSGGTGNSTTLVNAAGQTGGLVSLTQLVFDFNHTLDLVRAADAQWRSAQHSFTKAQIDAVLNVKAAYYTFVQNQGQVSVQQAGVDSAQASLDVAQAELNAGLGAPADVVNAKTALANDVQTLIQARATMVTSRVALCLAMGIDPRTPITASASSTEAEENTSDMNVLVVQAIKTRPDVLAAIENLKAAGYTISAARSNNAPALTFALNAINEGDNDNALTGASIAGQLSVTWTFDDGGLTQGKIESAKAQAEEAKQQLQLVTQTVISDVSQAYVNVETAEQRVTVAQTQVENATENLKLAQGQYGAGVTPFVTVITAQAALTQAKSDQVNAIANLAQSRATLRHAMGLGL